MPNRLFNGRFHGVPATTRALGFVRSQSGSFALLVGSLVEFPGSFVVRQVRSQARSGVFCAIRYISIANESLYATIPGFRCIWRNTFGLPLRYTRHVSGSVALYATSRPSQQPKHKRSLWSALIQPTPVRGDSRSPPITAQPDRRGQFFVSPRRAVPGVARQGARMRKSDGV